MTNGGVWRLDTGTGAWTDITPEHPVPGSKEFGYAAVAVDAQHPQTIIASTFGHPCAGGGDNIFRSTDGGATWKPVFGGAQGGVYDYCLAPYVKSTPIHWLFDIEIDPANSDHAVFTTGYGGWETFDLTAADRGQPTHWSVMATGIEETVALDLLSPAQGAHLITAIGDYGGFVHWDLDHPAPEGSSAPPRMGNTTGLASAALHPEIIVRVGIGAEHKPGENIGYPLDEGRTWKPTRSTPTAASRAGTIAVSADGATWIWTPQRQAPSEPRTRASRGPLRRAFNAGVRVIADPVEPQSFYAISFRRTWLFTAALTGEPPSPRSISPCKAQPASIPLRGDPRGGQDRLYAAPGHTGDLWLDAFDGLYRIVPIKAGTDNRSISFERLPGVSEIHAFGFGRAAPRRTYPALYLAGTIRGQPGIFRSIDEARSWVRINDDQHQWGLILQIAGDPRIYGRVYIGTHGRGVLYGEPSPHGSRHNSRQP